MVNAEIITAKKTFNRNCFDMADFFIGLKGKTKKSLSR